MEVERDGEGEDGEEQNDMRATLQTIEDILDLDDDDAVAQHAVAHEIKFVEAVYEQVESDPMFVKTQRFEKGTAVWHPVFKSGKVVKLFNDQCEVLFKIEEQLRRLAFLGGGVSHAC
eukprot:6771194-Prymnesium_polylepis.1